MTKEIYDAVEQHLSQNHVSYFIDLSEAEKSLLLERAARSLSTADNGIKKRDLDYEQQQKNIITME